MIVYPNAKINIGLNVTERRPDGYHNLETIFYPIELLDVIEITDSQQFSIKVTGTVLDNTPEDNLVTKAYRLLEREYDLPPVCIHLHKHIPTGAGLGGGSSDAAFTLKALNTKYQLGLDIVSLEKYASQLGADCAFFINNQPVLATGIGNIFSPISLSLKGKTIILIKPDVFVSTADAYRHVIPKMPEVSLAELVKKPLKDWKDCVENDFERSVFLKYPEIAAIKDLLYDIGAEYASMSGSGSAVYGIFDSPIENIDEIFAGYFVRQRKL
ncbi:MAG: 4-(cytidine 5'-diphospho)-2-C-methyl-D-erythritol kinase [Bacteroidaceae bacterium]|nr:4-(cytidine 5'-diphospho)-2-C-methyl-D-erythritol kinase [Bacteroidaceae bacterium]